MIKSFADKATAAVFSGQLVRRLPHGVQGIARRKLILIDATGRIEELRIPLAIGWNNSAAIEPDNGAFESTTNGGYVLIGKAVMQQM